MFVLLAAESGAERRTPKPGGYSGIAKRKKRSSLVSWRSMDWDWKGTLVSICQVAKSEVASIWERAAAGFWRESLRVGSLWICARRLAGMIRPAISSLKVGRFSWRTE